MEFVLHKIKRTGVCFKKIMDFVLCKNKRTRVCFLKKIMNLFYIKSGELVRGGLPYKNDGRARLVGVAQINFHP